MSLLVHTCIYSDGIIIQPDAMVTDHMTTDHLVTCQAL